MTRSPCTKSFPGESLNSFARELDINRNTLKSWMARYFGHRRACIADTPDAAAVTAAERIRQLERDNIRLREERDILRRAAKYFAEETCLVSRFEFVDDGRTDYPVRRQRTVLNLNRSSYYKWRKSRSARQLRLLADAALTARITAVFDEHQRCYGARRVTAELAVPPMFPAPRTAAA